MPVRPGKIVFHLPAGFITCCNRRESKEAVLRFSLAIKLLLARGTSSEVPLLGGNWVRLWGIFNKTCIWTPDMRSNPAERRRAPRIHLQVPVYVRGVDASGANFLELTRTLDISARGAFLASPRALRADSLITLTIPAPPPFGSGVLPPDTPPIQARVRRQQPSGNLQLVAVEFVHTLD